jgi:hypothetical protein
MRNARQTRRATDVGIDPRRPVDRRGCGERTPQQAAGGPAAPPGTPDGSHTTYGDGLRWRTMLRGDVSEAAAVRRGPGRGTQCWRNGATELRKSGG